MGLKKEIGFNKIHFGSVVLGAILGIALHAMLKRTRFGSNRLISSLPDTEIDY